MGWDEIGGGPAHLEVHPEGFSYTCKCQKLVSLAPEGLLQKPQPHLSHHQAGSGRAAGARCGWGAPAPGAREGATKLGLELLGGLLMSSPVCKGQRRPFAHVLGFLAAAGLVPSRPFELQP